MNVCAFIIMTLNVTVQTLIIKKKKVACVHMHSHTTVHFCVWHRVELTLMSIYMMTLVLGSCRIIKQLPTTRHNRHHVRTDNKSAMKNSEKIKMSITLNYIFNFQKAVRGV